MTAELYLTRRQALLAPLAAGAVACASAPAGVPLDDAFRNRTTLSESVHSGVASPDGQRRLTVRLCRYPELGQAWIWVHARTPAGFFSYVDHLAPCTHSTTPEAADRVLYSDREATLTFERMGSADHPESVRISGRCRARRETESRFGRGDHDLQLQIDFSPARLYSGLLAGRTEVFGRSRARLTIAGDTFDIEGPAQFHEQRQTTPRFTQPFCYGTLWGEDAASTFLVTARRREGYVLEGAGSAEIKSIALDPPGSQRRVAMRLADGRLLEGSAATVQAYTVPIVGNRWRGHMIDMALGGRRYFGHINDYLTEAVPYADVPGGSP